MKSVPELYGRVDGTHMMRRTAVVIGLVVCVVAVGYGQANNPQLGVWKLDPAKSKATGAAVTSGTTKIEQAGTAVKYTVDATYADGSKRHWEYTAAYDGKDVRTTGNGPYGDTIALTKVGARTVRATNKMRGKVTAT